MNMQEIAKSCRSCSFPQLGKKTGLHFALYKAAMLRPFPLVLQLSSLDLVIFILSILIL